MTPCAIPLAEPRLVGAGKQHRRNFSTERLSRPAGGGEPAMIDDGTN
jgi:hypothetical protein